MLINLVQNVGDLINQYGLDTVRATVEYVGKYSEINNVRVGDYHTDVWFTISREQFRSIGDNYRAGNKITAIKMLREIVACGLKEAKDVVENTPW